MSDIGTVIHDWAYEHILRGHKYARSDKRNIIFDLSKAGIDPIALISLDVDLIFENLMNYVNDAIGFGMDPEVEVKYNEDCFGTADALKYSEKEKFLRIHDLKTGTTPAHMEQLMIYAALYCLQHRYKPYEMSFECRLYQSGEIIFHNPTGEEITALAQVIVDKTNFIDKMRGGRIW
jgi:hypothetical protein